jgi:hypothetical protein
MLPSKDNAVRVSYSPDCSPVDERDEAVNRVHGDDSLSWKKQPRVDLKPSLHRDKCVVLQGRC